MIKILCMCLIYVMHVFLIILLFRRSGLPIWQGGIPLYSTLQFGKVTYKHIAADIALVMQSLALAAFICSYTMYPLPLLFVALLLYCYSYVPVALCLLDIYVSRNPVSLCLAVILPWIVMLKFSSHVNCEPCVMAEGVDDEEV